MPPKRRRRFQGLYYHSSPPKVLPMNGQITNSNGRRRRDPDDLSVKLSTIRIWMHEKDIGKLTRVLWAGQGNRLRQQASTNPRVKRFLAAVPYVMNSIKDVHQAVIDNNLENLQSNLEPPVPPALITCRDANGLNLIHKAAGLGHATILEYLIGIWPDGVHETDITGKTPLHWAASAKNNMRCYTLLTQAGCDEEAVDYKMKTPSFYRHKPHEIERAFLTFVPEAPRVSPDVATDWEALSDESGDGKKLDIKIPEMNGFGRHSNAESNTSEAEMTEAASGQEDEEMSKEEDAAEENDDAEADDEKESETKDENEEEPAAEEEAKEETEAEEPADTEENQEPEEPEKQEEESEEKKEEQPQDEKLQTDTLNDTTTANLTKDSDDQETTESSQDHKESLEEKKLEEPNTGDDKEQDKNENLSDESNNSKESETEIKGEELEEKNLKKDQTEENKEQGEQVKEETGDLKSSAEEGKEEKTSEVDLVEKKEDSPNDNLKSDNEKVTNLDEKAGEPVGDEESKDNLEEKTKDSVEEVKDDKDKDETKSNEGEVKEIDDKDDKEETGIDDKKDKEDIKVDDEKDKSEEEKDKRTDSEKVGDKTEEVSDEKKENEEDKDNADSKTLGETLVDIKDEVKDNVKFLANQIKNVFSDKTKDKEENLESKEEETKDETETKTEKEETKLDDNETVDKTSSKETESKENANDKLEENDKIEQSPAKESSEINESKTNTEESKDEKEKSEAKSETKTPSTDNTKETDENTQPKSPPKTSDSINSQDKTNSSNDNQTPPKTQTPPSTANKTPTKESPKKANDKTEEDENNNTNNLNNQTETNSTSEQSETTSKPSTAEAAIDDQFKELNKSLEEYKQTQNSLEETEKTIGDKLEVMADNLKDNVKELSDKVVSVFSNTKDNEENLETENNEIVVHADTPRKSTSGKKLVKDNESSDDTADDDEEPTGEAESQENNEENDNENEKKEAEAEPEPEIVAEPEPDEQAEPEGEAEPEQDTPNETETKDEDDQEEETKDPEDNLDNEAEDGEGSPTSSLAIEGFVQGDAEDNTVQSQTAAYVHDDEETRIQNIIASGDMEQLAQIVLNGDGQKLLNIEAQEPEIQAFLRNVPNYMGKIKRVHEAARNGSLLNLQQALDRRKFAIAKDEVSPNGATPLHVAVLFGNSDIVRYLSARFPETTTITDDDGRTALHYAAVINDNGHFYNVLLQLGANPKVVDKLGHTPEDYLSKDDLKDTLNYGQLLKRFGAEELEEQLLSDQGQIENQNCQENPIFKTEQGKYLADNLADPLIKALTQVAHKRPTDPLQYLTNYLQSYVASRNTNGRTITQAAIHSGSSQTNSTRLASSKPSTPAQIRQTNQMNGHVKNFANADNIEEDTMHQVQEFEGDDDDDSDSAMSKKLEERDEHGQSMLHFACARSHRKGGLIHLIEETKADITYRDELYRTARDVALQANQLGNAKEIDRYVMSLAIVGDIKPFEHFAISGYDHIIDVLDDNETPIIDVVEARGLHDLAEYLKTIRPLEELREEMHQMIRDNKVERVKEIADSPSGKWLIKAKNYYGRTALHIAILKESVEIVEYFIKLCPEALKIGDNLERTPLHYAMGTNIIESISHILIQNGAKRTYKDLKGRQPSYYFMNKADILRLQEEEDENR